MQAIGKVGLTLKLMVMWTVLEWLLTPILVVKYGFVGDAYASVIISFTSIVPIIIIKRIVDIDILKSIWQPLLASVVMFVLVIAYGNYFVTDKTGVIVQVMLGGLVYGIVMILAAKEKVKENMKGLIH
jgi:O-antigen/teichoic acid export membrane protein